MTDQKFTFNVPGTLANKVECIKAIRTLTGLGLREAKDATEKYGPQTHNLDMSYWNRAGLNPATGIEEQFRILRNNGIEVGEPVFKLLEELRKIGAQALRQGEDELANEILQIVLVEKLRRGPGFSA